MWRRTDQACAKTAIPVLNGLSQGAPETVDVRECRADLQRLKQAEDAGINCCGATPHLPTTRQTSIRLVKRYCDLQLRLKAGVLVRTTYVSDTSSQTCAEGYELAREPLWGRIIYEYGNKKWN